MNQKIALSALPQPAVEAEGSSLDRDMLRAHFALLQRQAIAAELLEDPSGAHVFRV